VGSGFPAFATFISGLAGLLPFVTCLAVFGLAFAALAAGFKTLVSVFSAFGSA
jgi:hypothetical protein